MEEGEEIGVAEMKDYDLSKILILCALALLFEIQKAEMKSEKKEWREGGFGSVSITHFLCVFDTIL